MLREMVGCTQQLLPFPRSSRRVPDMNDLNDALAPEDTVEDFESIFLDELAMHASNVCLLRSARISFDELD